MDDDERRAEIERLRDIRAAFKTLGYDAWRAAYGMSADRWRERCGAAFGLPPAVGQVLVLRGFDPARLRRTADETLLAFPKIGPGALARIRAAYPYEPPTSLPL